MLRLGRPLLNRWPDLVILGGLLAGTYGLVVAATRYSRVAAPAAEIDLSPAALPLYALLSAGRMLAAYGLSLAFSISYARMAVKNRQAERLMLPALDILQSVPIMAFFPAAVLAATALFPGSLLGPELAAILLIFTSQAWNLAFSFYGSLISIPQELREAATSFRLNGWLRFTRLELPFGLIPLILNSVMSWANGWFFLMAAEQFGVGSQSFKLPGLGAYLRTAADREEVGALGLGLLTLIGLVVAVDQLLWRPLLQWADRFRYEQTGGLRPPGAPVLGLLRRSALVGWVLRAILRPAVGLLDEVFNQIFRWLETRMPRPSKAEKPGRRRWFWVGAGLGAAAGVGWGLAEAAQLLLGLGPADWVELAAGAGASFARVLLVLAVAAAWAVPVGVGVGLRRELGARVLPLVQLAASVPATALFPAVVLLVIRLPAGMELAAVFLMLLGSQWYVLFNVVAGALTIPGDLLDAAEIFRLGGWVRWRRLLLPGIFPHLVTGLITAAGAAWNATVVGEYVSFGGETYRTVGLGSFIVSRAETGDTAGLLAGTILMAFIVVSLNRLFWRRLYGWAEARFRLD